MSELDKVLEWVVANTFDSERGETVRSVDLVLFIDSVKNPAKKLVWHYRTRDNDIWRPATDEEYDKGSELSRFEWKQIEV